MLSAFIRLLRIAGPIAAALALNACSTVSSALVVGTGMEEVRQRLGSPDQIVAGGSPAREQWVYIGHDYHKGVVPVLSPTERLLLAAAETYPIRTGVSSYLLPARNGVLESARRPAFEEVWTSTPYPKTVIVFEKGKLVGVVHPPSPSQLIASR